jgi:hypothetical protein
MPCAPMLWLHTAIYIDLAKSRSENERKVILATIS